MIHGHVLVEQRLDRGIHLLDFSLVLANRGPAQHALEVTQTRIHGQINEGEDDGDNKQPAPPLRHRVVVFLKVSSQT
jgi:hypothetical protein